jgi:hypothetical protein
MLGIVTGGGGAPGLPRLGTVAGGGGAPRLGTVTGGRSTGALACAMTMPSAQRMTSMGG